MSGRFERLHREPRRLTDGEKLRITLAGAALLIALELWWGERLGFGLGLVAGWVLAELNRWLERRGG